MTSIRDWNVSRQLWWGHRIPAWYCPDGHVTVSAEPDGPRGVRGVRAAGERARSRTPTSSTRGSAPGCGRSRPSAGPTRQPDYERFYPTSVMETGYDIIFFWVARMMMLGIHLTGEVPFHTVYLSGLIRDPEGQKMSKTKGNVVDPLAVIDETGADALRFAVIHGTTPGLDQKFGRTKLENARNFANKLWNATRFVAGARPASIPEDAPRAEVDERRLGPTERWLRSRVAATTTAVDEAMAGLRLRRGHADPVRRDLERVLRLGPGARQGAPGRRVAAGGGARGDVVDARRRARRLPAAAASGHAVRDGGAVGRDPAPRVGSGAAHRGPLAGRLGNATSSSRSSSTQLFETITAIRNARATARIDAPSWLETHVAAGRRLRVSSTALAPAIERLARARPLGPARAGPRTCRARRAASRSCSRPATSRRPCSPAASGDAAILERTRLEKELAEAEGWLAAARARLANSVVRREGPAGRGRRRARTRARARGAGGSAPGAARGLTPSGRRPCARSSMRA